MLSFIFSALSPVCLNTHLTHLYCKVCLHYILVDNSLHSQHQARAYYMINRLLHLIEKELIVDWSCILKVVF